MRQEILVAVTHSLISRGRLVATLAVLGTSLCANGAPVTLVDTGASHEGYPGYTLANYQWLARQFSVAEPMAITAIEGWIGRQESGSTAPFAASIVLYGDGAARPGALLFETAFTVPGLADGPFTQWLGATNLDWNVGPGSYWVAFQTTAAWPDFEAFMPSPTPNPLQTAAAYYDSRSWRSTSSLDIGLRIVGTPVPVPAAAWLLVPAFGLLGWIRARPGN